MKAVKRQFKIVDQNNKQVAKFSCIKQEEVWKRYNSRSNQLLGLDAESVTGSVYGGMYWKNSDSCLFLEEVF